MNWKSHLSIALICAFAALYFFLGITDAVRLLYLGAFAGVAGLLPDIDTDESKGRAALDVAVVAGASFLSYSSFCGGGICMPALDQLLRIAILALALLGIYFIFMKFVMPRHRGIVHSIIACLAFTALLYVFIDRFFALAGFVGYMSHLVADNEIKLK
jgi:membrane-bound metal-dependent hydrolase YbcI (DUF457 family)